MEQNGKGLWHYFEKWRSLNDGARPLIWEGGRLSGGWCEDCRFCCGEQDSSEPFPMGLLQEQIGPENKNDFYMLNENTAGLGREGCKSLASAGCSLPFEKRPPACGFFPIVLINGSLYLYQTCPAAMFLPLERFYRLGREIAAYLQKFSLSDLKRVSISMPLETLSKKYIDLHIRIFDEEGKKFVFE